jgi:endoglucanase
VADITKPGDLEYSCQFYRDGISLNNGFVYDVSFDIRSDLDRSILWRYQINGGDYHAYYEEEDRIGTKTKHISARFRMEEASDPAPRLCFNVGSQGDLDAGTSNKIYLDNFTMTVADASEAMAIESLPEAKNVKVNQLGYNINDEKTVVCKYNRDLDVFEIHDAGTDEVVYSGTLSHEFTNSKSGDFAVTNGDFTDFKTPGTYYISIPEYGNSFEFEIKDGIYEDVYEAAVHMLYLQRCGMELTRDMAGDYAHDVCHSGMATVYGTDKKTDVSGGWHDAGDYGRYVVPGAKTIADLFLTFESEDESEAVRDDLNIPESGNKVPDLLDEARYELEFFFKMQADNGGVYHKVTCADFPGTVMPEDETARLIVSPVSATATADFAAVMAKGARLYEKFDPEFAAKCLDASKRAFEFMEKEGVKMPGFKNPEGINTGEYPDSDSRDEYFWSAVELYITTGDEAYLSKASEIYEKAKWTSLSLGWSDMSGYGTYAYLTRPEGLAGDAALTKKLEGLFTAYAEKQLSFMDDDAYFISLGADYPWGSNMTVAGNGILYCMAGRITGDDRYQAYARHQFDYLLGINPLSYCYVTGFGDLTPEHPHHRPSQFRNHAMPGMLVGGPNSSPADPYAIAVLEGKKGASCYVDNDSSYSTNEISIYWNSPFICLAGWLK